MERRLGSACRRIREQAGLDLIDIATTAHVSQSTVSRFELGQGWVRATNTLVDTYADVGALTPEDVWKIAIDEPE